MVTEIYGPWKKGFAFDVHTVSSTYLGPDEWGHDRFENERSEMGELVYQLKYKQDRSALAGIVELLDRVSGIEKFDMLIPIPPTDKTRAFQPVTEIAKALGQRRGVAVRTDILDKKPGGPPLKNIDDPAERAQLLQAAMILHKAGDVSGRTILLIDDLYRSGATLEAATALLLQAGAANVSALTMTKTRSKS